jgi:hypothetical protein
VLGRGLRGARWKSFTETELCAWAGSVGFRGLFTIARDRGSKRERKPLPHAGPEVVEPEPSTTDQRLYFGHAEALRWSDEKRSGKQIDRMGLAQGEFRAPGNANVAGKVAGGIFDNLHKVPASESRLVTTSSRMNLKSGYRSKKCFQALRVSSWRRF